MYKVFDLMSAINWSKHEQIVKFKHFSFKYDDSFIYFLKIYH